MIAIAKKNKVMIQEATMMRFHPQTQYVKKMIKDKKIGKVHYISAIFSITNLWSGLGLGLGLARAPPPPPWTHEAPRRQRLAAP